MLKDITDIFSQYNFCSLIVLLLTFLPFLYIIMMEYNKEEEKFLSKLYHMIVALISFFPFVCMCALQNRVCF